MNQKIDRGVNSPLRISGTNFLSESYEVLLVHQDYMNKLMSFFIVVNCIDTVFIRFKRPTSNKRPPPSPKKLKSTRGVWMGLKSTKYY